MSEIEKMLGRKSHDPEALAATPRHYAAGLMPQVLDRSGLAFCPGLYGNDLLPDCTAAGLANAARGAAWRLAGADILVDTAKVEAFYATCAGCADDFIAMSGTDGARILDVLDQASAHGFDIGQQVPLVPLWARCEPDDRMAIADAIFAGPAVLGVNLSVSDRSLIGSVWTTKPGPTAGDAAPGSWGGHCLIAWDYTGLGDGDIVRLGTWGAWQMATWAWVHSRVDEAYHLTWRQLQRA